MHERIKLLLTEEFHLLRPLALSDLIRVGRDNDGGYVVPNRIISESDFLVSLGVFDDWSFERFCLCINPNMKVHSYDYTVSSSYFGKKIIFGVIKFLFLKLSIKDLKRRIHLFFDFNNFFSSHAIHFPERVRNRKQLSFDVTPQDIIERTNSSRIFLKVDIEGSEYRILEYVLLHYSDKLNGVIVEFHDTFPYREKFNKIIQIFSQNFVIAHVHANNYGDYSDDGLPEVLEITFMSRKLLKSCELHSVTFTNFLPLKKFDCPCDPNSADFEISFV
jgi:hypothetical protein